MTKVLPTFKKNHSHSLNTNSCILLSSPDSTKSIGINMVTISQ